MGRSRNPLYYYYYNHRAVIQTQKLPPAVLVKLLEQHPQRCMHEDEVVHSYCVMVAE